jgi:hypothetical protein
MCRLTNKDSMTDLSSIENPADQIDQVLHRHPCSPIRAGIKTGALLIVVMLVSLVIANRVPSLERYALERNAASYGLFVMLMLYPVIRFLNRPRQMFFSAMIGWVMFAAAYDLTGMFFHDLFDVLRTPFQALIEGALVYGVIAGILWVGEMILHARRHSIAPGRKNTRHLGHHTR